MAAAILILTGFGQTQADMIYKTPIGVSNERSLIGPGGILDSLYGWGNLTRLDDFGNGLTDQFWMITAADGIGTATVQAKYAGFPLTFGVLSGTDGWDFQSLTTLGANQYGIYGQTKGMPSQHPKDFTVHDVGSVFRFALDLPSQNGFTWSSFISDNITLPRGFAGDGTDHMVTWMITGNIGYGQNRIGHFVVGWEDLGANSRLGYYDGDFNDLIVELSGVAPMEIEVNIIPEPAMAVLLISGGVWASRFRKKRAF